VVTVRCRECNKNVRKKIKWFPVNSRQLFAVGYCEKHGFIKSKIRLVKYDGEKVFAIKTTKYISEEEKDRINTKKEHALEMRKKHKQSK
jgi:hypothetical protein